jgi:hypothetical protein
MWLTLMRSEIKQNVKKNPKAQACHIFSKPDVDKVKFIISKQS